MIKTTYKDYIGIIGVKTIRDTEHGKVIRVVFVKQKKTLLEKILAFFGMYINYMGAYFWCPPKAIFSSDSYGIIGKRSRGVYSNVWYELTNIKDNNVGILKDLTPTLCSERLRPIRMTNKKMKEYLDKYLPE